MRRLHSNDVRNRQKYILRRHQFLQDRNFYQRIVKLQPLHEPPQDGHHRVVEALDKDWVASALYAESFCARRTDPAYVIELTKWRRRKSILLKMLTQSSTSVDMSACILKLQNYGPINDIPTTVPEIRRAI
jgi:hypothetical protein